MYDRTVDIFLHHKKLGNYHITFTVLERRKTQQHSQRIILHFREIPTHEKFPLRCYNKHYTIMNEIDTE